MGGFLRFAVVAMLLTPGTGAAQDLGAGLAAFEAGDYATALGEFMPLAEQGNDIAQGNLGFMYEHGHGVPQDYAEAVRWFRAYAEQGNARAQGHLGYMYEQGLGVPQDDVTAHKWLSIAAARGQSFAVELRERISRRMSAREISDSRRRTQACTNSGYQACD